MILIFVSLLVALLNVCAHWFPWAVLPGAADGRGKLKRLLAFGWGTFTIWLGFGVYAAAVVWTGLTLTPWAYLGALSAVMTGAGLGTLAGYLVDVLHEFQARGQDIGDYETLTR